MKPAGKSVGKNCKSTFLNVLVGKQKKENRMIGVIVQFQKLACVEKWKDTVLKWALMTKVY